MRAAWWWIDRWRNSTAYTDMTAEEQGLYRNLLDEVWMRPDHVIPDDQRVLARISGDHEAWKRSGRKVLQWMKKVPNGWTHIVALEVIKQSTRRAEIQKKYRNKSHNAAGNEDGNAGHNEEPNEAPNAGDSLSLDPSLTSTDNGNGALSPSPSQASVTANDLEPCSSNKEESGIPDEARQEYAEAVRQAFAARTGKSTYQVMGEDYHWLKRWMDIGIRLSVVLTGINETRYVGHTMAYYNPSVMAEYERTRLALSGTR